MDNKLRGRLARCLLVGIWSVSTATYSNAQVNSGTDKIVFESRRDGNSEVYVMNSDGSNQVNLTNNSNNDRTPSWSPDRQLITFSRKAPTGNAGGDIYTMDAQGQNVKNVTNDGPDDMEPSFTPDGQSIVYSAFGGFDYDVFQTDLNGWTKTRVINNPLGDYQPRVNPAGNRIAFHTYPDYQTADTHVADFGGGNQVRLNTGGGHDYDAEWSPDGSRLVFSSERSGNFEIYSMKADGTDVVRLTYNNIADEAPCYSRDGSKIVFASNRDGDFEIFVMDVDGSNQTQLTFNNAEDHDPCWGVSTAYPKASINDITMNENETATFTITLSSPCLVPASIQYSTVSGTAVSGYDFTPANGTVNFAAGETSKQVTIAVTDDAIDENDETFSLVLTNPTNLLIQDGTGIATIVDNDNGPAISIGDAIVVEGNSGTTNAHFTVSLSNPSAKPVSTSYIVVAGSASANTDVILSSGEVSFQPNITMTTLPVAVVGDNIDEWDESFKVVLSNPINATILVSQGVGLIQDDDATPSITISDTSIAENDSGTQNATLIVQLSALSEKGVSVEYSTLNGTAVAPGDYSPRSGSLTFNANETSKLITVPVVGDTLDESNEALTVFLSNPVAATLTDNSGRIDIIDDDPAALSIGDVSVFEGDKGTKNRATFQVMLSKPVTFQVKVKYATAFGTATSKDFSSSKNTLVFKPGETVKTFQVQIQGDSQVESDEIFYVNLSGANGVGISDSQAIGTIRNDDGP